MRCCEETSGNTLCSTAGKSCCCSVSPAARLSLVLRSPPGKTFLASALASGALLNRKKLCSPGIVTTTWAELNWTSNLQLAEQEICVVV